jgi:hypothetical protein
MPMSRARKYERDAAAAERRECAGQPPLQSAANRFTTDGLVASLFAVGTTGKAYPGHRDASEPWRRDEPPRPMWRFMRWRSARRRSATSVPIAALTALIALNDAEVAIVVVIPFAAALMARGAWLF